MLVLLPAVISCKKKQENNHLPVDSNDVQTDPNDTDTKKKTEAELPDVDYNGYVFQVKTRKQDLLDKDICVSSPDSDVDESVWARANFLSENYGVELILHPASNSKMDASEMNAILLNTCDSDLIATHGRNAMTYAIKGCAYNWYDLKWVDLGCDWWCQGAVNNWTVNGKVYCMIGDLSYVNFAEANCMYFNKSLLRQSEIEYPYQDVMDGKWTLERMKEIALEAYNGMNKTGTGALADDSFAYTTGWWRGPMNLVYSAGGYVIRGNSSETFELGCYNETIQNAYTEYFDNFLFMGGNVCSTEAPENYALMEKAFNENRVVFYSDIILNVSKFKGTDFGILPFPKYNENIEGYPTLVNAASNIFVVPKTAPDPERTGVILEAMSFFGHKNIVPVYYDEVLSYKLSPDIESTQVLQMIRQYLVYDLGYYYVFGCGIGDLGQMCFKAGSAKGLATLYASLKPVAEARFSDWDNIK